MRNIMVPVILAFSFALAVPAIAADEFVGKVQPLLAKSCYGCHNDKLKTANINLASFHTAASLSTDPETWEKVITKLRDGTMPPPGMPRPKQPDVEAATTLIETELTRAEQSLKPDPGRITARRLNRAEYNNTIRDLLGINIHPADDFPQDDSGYGFDNIADVLSISPVLLERYLKAAETEVRTALFGAPTSKPVALRAQPPSQEFPLFPKAQPDYDVTGLSAPSALHATMRFPAEGDYQVRVALEGRRPNGSEPLHIGLWLDGKQVQTLTIDAPSDGQSIDLFGAQADVRLHLPAGDHWIAASLLRIYEGLPESYGGANPTKRPVPAASDVMRFVKIPPGATPDQIADLKKRAEERRAKNQVPANRVWVHWVEALGPYNAVTGPAAESQKRLFVCDPHQSGCDRKILTQFAHRAFRRPVEPAELQPYFKLVADARKSGASFKEALAPGLEAILVSPDFLFRIEKDDPSSEARPISQLALASRLSYFLWSSMPDDELLHCAEQQQLRKPEVLKAQVNRMLSDPKSHALVENFAGQWLELRRLESVAPDRTKFPLFDDYLRMSMRQETETFFDNMLRHDGSILDLLDAKYTFINEKLATFYGIPNVKGPEFRRVSLEGTPRGGVLTQASVLTVSSYATRTSPVLRGKWILENFLNQPIPPPPPNVPALDETKIGASGSMRHQMEEHRANPACASCHSKMDPLGFGFENFNAIGEWRTLDGKFPIDPSGKLPDGRTFQTPGELKTLLRKDQNAFAECVTDKLLTYALGRGLERYDHRTVKDISTHVAADDFRFSAIVMDIVNSLPFQQHRSERNKT